MKLLINSFLFSIIILTVIFIFWHNPKLVSKTQDIENRLENALDLAGENRNELEKVLAHYQKDSLKFKAASFLIENMDNCYSELDISV